MGTAGRSFQCWYGGVNNPRSAILFPASAVLGIMRNNHLMMNPPRPILWLVALVTASIIAPSRSEADSAMPPAPRVVSLSPNLTEIVCQLGCEGRLVGRSSACDYPESIKRLPVCGDFGKPAVEAIFSLRTTHLLVAGLEQPVVAETLRQGGVKVLVLPTNRIEDYYAAVAAIGDELGVAAAATEENRRVRRGITAFRREIRDLPDTQRPLVYFEVWGDPPMTVGRDSYLHQMITLAGGRNLGEAQPGGYFRCSSEWVIARAPAVIIAPAMSPSQGADLARRPGWQAIPAIRERRIYVALDQNLLYRLGPRLLDGLALLRRCIRPPTPDAEKDKP